MEFTSLQEAVRWMEMKQVSQLTDGSKKMIAFCYDKYHFSISILYIFERKSITAYCFMDRYLLLQQKKNRTSFLNSQYELRNVCFRDIQVQVTLF